MRPITLLCVAAAGLAGCATPAQRIAARLEAAGASPGYAHCVGEALDDRLSLVQLRQLSRGLEAAAAAGTEPEALTRAARRLGDPAIMNAVGAAGLGCLAR